MHYNHRGKWGGGDKMLFQKDSSANEMDNSLGTRSFTTAEDYLNKWEGKKALNKQKKMKDKIHQMSVSSISKWANNNPKINATTCASQSWMMEWISIEASSGAGATSSVIKIISKRQSMPRRDSTRLNYVKKITYIQKNSPNGSICLIKILNNARIRIGSMKAFLKIHWMMDWLIIGD